MYLSLSPVIKKYIRNPQGGQDFELFSEDVIRFGQDVYEAFEHHKGIVLKTRLLLPDGQEKAVRPKLPQIYDVHDSAESDDKEPKTCRSILGANNSTNSKQSGNDETDSSDIKTEDRKIGETKLGISNSEREKMLLLLQRAADFSVVEDEESHFQICEESTGEKEDGRQLSVETGESKQLLARRLLDDTNKIKTSTENSDTSSHDQNSKDPISVKGEYEEPLLSHEIVDSSADFVDSSADTAASKDLPASAQVETDGIGNKIDDRLLIKANKKEHDFKHVEVLQRVSRSLVAHQKTSFKCIIILSVTVLLIILYFVLKSFVKVHRNIDVY